MKPTEVRNLRTYTRFANFSEKDEDTSQADFLDKRFSQTINKVEREMGRVINLSIAHYGGGCVYSVLYIPYD